jgi:hypothetical protein
MNARAESLIAGYFSKAGWADRGGIQAIGLKIQTGSKSI